jgi:hypothetical protein
MESKIYTNQVYKASTGVLLSVFQHVLSRLMMQPQFLDRYSPWLWRSTVVFPKSRLNYFTAVGYGTVSNVDRHRDILLAFAVVQILF